MIFIRCSAHARPWLVLLAFLLPLRLSNAHSAESIAATTYQVGTAAVNITPPYPVRLSGFGFRRAESEGVTQAIWAKALAVGDDREEPAVLITVDNLGVPEELVSAVAARLQKKA